MDPISSVRVVIYSDVSPQHNFKELSVILHRMYFNEKLISLSLDLFSVDVYI